MNKGLLLSVYKNANCDCTNGGVTATATQLTLVGIKRGGEIEPLSPRAQVFAPTKDAPAVILCESALPGMYGPHLEPLEHADGVGPMMGGNYAASSDSRWSELGELFGHGRISAVPVHDRVESYKLYQQLSSD
jgi:hypothetical protein